MSDEPSPAVRADLEEFDHPWLEMATLAHSVGLARKQVRNLSDRKLVGFVLSNHEPPRRLYAARSLLELEGWTTASASGLSPVIGRKFGVLFVERARQLLREERVSLVGEEVEPSPKWAKFLFYVSGPDSKLAYKLMPPDEKPVSAVIEEFNVLRSPPDFPYTLDEPHPVPFKPYELRILPIDWVVKKVLARYGVASRYQRDVDDSNPPEEDRVDGG